VRRLPHTKPPGRERGVVLVVALVLLVAVMVLSLAGINTTTLELRMAANHQARVTAFQEAQSGIAAVKTDGTNFAVTGSVGAVRCTDSFDHDRYYDAELSCSATDLVVPNNFELTYKRAAVMRLPPRLQPAPRFIETSAEKLKVATYKIDSRFDDRDNGGSRAEHNQGLIVTVLTPSEETVVTESDFE